MGGHPSATIFPAGTGFLRAARAGGEFSLQDLHQNYNQPRLAQISPGVEGVSAAWVPPFHFCLYEMTAAIAWSWNFPGLRAPSCSTLPKPRRYRALETLTPRLKGPLQLAATDCPHPVGHTMWCTTDDSQHEEGTD